MPANKRPVERWILDPLTNFVNNSTASGMVLFASAITALIISNSPWADAFHHLWETHFSISIGSFAIDKSLHHWINDGLMSMFFFVVGLELKREIMAGELRNPRNAMLPIFGAIGGMVFPALIFVAFNAGEPSLHGWGIPMATDIAFALGVVYLLGDKVPVSLKVFLTALAIIDDLGAVLVIAFFYTSDFSALSLFTGIGFMFLLLLANRMGVRSALFYGIVGICGMWTAFLMSGIHATIAAVLAAFTIPADVRISEIEYIKKMEKILDKFRKATPNDVTLVTPEQLHIVEDAVKASNDALTPLQRLEHAMHPVVAFVVMPVFALANAGVAFNSELLGNLGSPLALGVLLGLLIGKSFGIFGFSWLAVKTGLASKPHGTNWNQFIGISFLGGIGFTMSLFITTLAFDDPGFTELAKMSILIGSMAAGLIGYFLLRMFSRSTA